MLHALFFKQYYIVLPLYGILSGFIVHLLPTITLNIFKKPP